MTAPDWPDFTVITSREGSIVDERYDLGDPRRVINLAQTQQIAVKALTTINGRRAAALQLVDATAGVAIEDLEEFARPRLREKLAALAAELGAAG